MRLVLQPIPSFGCIHWGVLKKNILARRQWVDEVEEFLV